MTSKELHEQKIIPLRKELMRLEKEYKTLYHKECSEKIGEQASCRNCALSCVICVADYNGCMGGKDTCCTNWCYSWTPENDVSKFLRENYHYDDSMFNRLEDFFGSEFVRECDKPEKAKVVMDMLQLVAKFDEKEAQKGECHETDPV